MQTPAEAAPRPRVIEWLAAATLLGLLLRAIGLTSESIWYDEGATLNAARHVNLSLDFLRTRVSMEMPVLAILVRGWYEPWSALFQAQPGGYAFDLILKLLPLMFGVATIPLMYQVVREITGDVRAGLAAAFLYAISPFQIYYAQEVRMYFILTPNLLVALWCFWRMLNTGEPRYWLGWIFALAFSLYNHPITLFYILTFNAIFIAAWVFHRRSLWMWVASQTLLFILCIPAFWLIRRADAALAAMPTSWYPRPTLKTALITVKDFFAGYSPNAAAYWPLFALAMLLVLIGCWRLRSKPVALAVLLGMAILPIAIGVVVWTFKSVTMYEHRLFIVAGAAFAALAAQGIAALPGIWLRIAALLAVAALTAPALLDHYQARLHPATEHRLGVRQKVDYRSAVAYIRERLQPGDITGHTSHASLFSFYHYLPQTPNPTLAFNQRDADDFVKFNPPAEHWYGTGAVPKPVSAVLSTASRLWLIETWWEPSDPQGLAYALRNWLDLHAERIDFADFQGLRVYCYENTRKTVNVLADAGVVNSVAYDESTTVAPPESMLPAPYRFSVAGALSIEGFDIEIRNAAPGNIAVEANAYPAAAIVDGHAFTTNIPASNLWRPSPQHNPRSWPYFFTRPVLTLTADDPIAADDFAQAPLSVDPGEYVAYAQCYFSAMPGHGRATLRVSFEDRNGQQSIGAIQGAKEGAPPGWHWTRAGTFVAQSEGKLVLRAENPNAYPLAGFDLARILVAPAAVAGYSDAPPALRFNSEVSPGGMGQIEVSGVEPSAKRLLVELVERDTGEIRSLLTSLP